MNNQLFTFRRCPYAIRARVALCLAGIDYEAIEVDFKNKPARLLEISPKGTVPVLVTNSGSVLDESLHIIEYALSQKLPEGFINVSTAQYELGALILADLDTQFIPALNRLKYPNRYEDVVIADEQKILNSCLQKWELGFKGKGVIADAYTYYDIAVMPLIRQLSKTDTEVLKAYPQISQWLDEWLGSDCMIEVMAKNNDNIKNS